MSEVKMWYRTCVVCKSIDVIEYLDLNANQNKEHKEDEAKTVVHTNCPDDSLKDANENYRS
ncbi:hypothetical protein ACLX1H_010005 [Fusarium chlamydosporum]